jgi:SAM-dependent methyltransferase
MDIYDNAKKSIQLLSQIQADDQPCEINTKSEMWEGYSRHDIDFDQINNLIFFDSGLLFRDGVGAASIKTYEEKKKQFFRFANSYGLLLSEDEFSRVRLAQAGTPIVFDFKGQLTTYSQIYNLSRYVLIERELGCNFLQNSSRVLEIGAGHGGFANVYLQICRPSEYVIVDLPETMLFSIFFLLSENSDTPVLVGEQDDSAESESAIRFFPPGNQTWNQRSFDLIVNCSSLGEMGLAVANNYHKIIASCLAEKGRFVSMNRLANFAERRERKQNEAIFLSDFELKEFEIIDISPDPCRGFICYPMLHIMIMGKRKESSPIIPSVEIDFLGIVSEFGFFAEAKEIRQKILKGLTDKDESNYINKFMNIVKDGSWEKNALDLMEVFVPESLNAFHEFLLFFISSKRISLEKIPVLLTSTKPICLALIRHIEEPFGSEFETAKDILSGMLRSNPDYMIHESIQSLNSLAHGENEKFKEISFHVSDILEFKGCCSPRAESRANS